MLRAQNEGGITPWCHLSVPGERDTIPERSSRVSKTEIAENSSPNRSHESKPLHFHNKPSLLEALEIRPALGMISRAVLGDGERTESAECLLSCFRVCLFLPWIPQHWPGSRSGCPDHTPWHLPTSLPGESRSWSSSMAVLSPLPPRAKCQGCRKAEPPGGDVPREGSKEADLASGAVFGKVWNVFPQPGSAAGPVPSTARALDWLGCDEGAAAWLC